MTKQDATAATHGVIFYHETKINADNTPMRVRVTGKCKLWKTRPDHFRLPVARGLYEHGYITHENRDEWNVNEWD